MTPRIIQSYNCHELKRCLKDSDSYSNKNIGLQNKSDYIYQQYINVYLGRCKEKNLSWYACIYEKKKKEGASIF